MHGLPGRIPMPAVLAAASFFLAVPGFAAEAPSYAARIAAVLDDIAARDLDTTKGPPLNAFITLNPYAVALTAALLSQLRKAVFAGAQQG